jgi:hypothetical protein
VQISLQLFLDVTKYGELLSAKLHVDASSFPPYLNLLARVSDGAKVLFKLRIFLFFSFFFFFFFFRRWSHTLQTLETLELHWPNFGLNIQLKRDKRTNGKIVTNVCNDFWTTFEFFYFSKLFYCYLFSRHKMRIFYFSFLLFCHDCISPPLLITIPSLTLSLVEKYDIPWQCTIE